MKTLILIIFTIFSQYSVASNGKESVTVWGELENPGLFKINKKTTLADLIPQKAIPLSIASTKRISIIRLGKVYEYDLKANGDFILESKDIITLPIKYLYEGQRYQIDHVFKATSKNANKSLKKIMKIQIKGIKIQKNEEGIEFRPIKDDPNHPWTRVLIRTSNMNSLTVYSRRPSLGMGEAKRLPYQIDLEKKIQRICALETN